MSGEEAISRRAAALFAWLNQVKADCALPASAFKVAFELGQWINGDAFVKDGALIAWPSLATIGAAISMSERTARDMVKRLETRGVPNASAISQDGRLVPRCSSLVNNSLCVLSETAGPTRKKL
jgi:hypothetical protein